ncbi:MAG: helix-turn-helix transcriptional regulator [Kiritimatiellae bacterium]|nr:helix-turn-helix transcriptional regulator [Kiritimatiellia bacterium]
MALDTKRLKRLMSQRNMTQRDLAQMSGVTEAAMSRYLAGSRQPKGETLANMATALHTTSNDLLGLEPPTEVEQVFRLVARNAAAIPNDVRLKLIRLLSEPRGGNNDEWDF